MPIYRRPDTVYDDTSEAIVLSLIAEGACNVYREFTGFCDLNKTQVKTTIDRLRRKGFVVYIPSTRAWKATNGGLAAYAELLP